MKKSKKFLVLALGSLLSFSLLSYTGCVNPQNGQNNTEETGDKDNSQTDKDDETTDDKDKDKEDSDTKDEDSDNKGGSDTKDDSGDSGNQDDKSDSDVTYTTTDLNVSETDLGTEWSTSLTLNKEVFQSFVSGSYITVTTVASAEEAAYYQLAFNDSSWEKMGGSDSCTNATFGSEYNTYSLNAAAQETSFTPSDSEITKLKAGGLIIGGYGVKITKVTVSIPDSSSDSGNTDSGDTDSADTISSNLSDPDATENTKRLYNYLSDVYGEKVITGMMENAWNDDCNMLGRVYSDTGKYPALMGFDFMNYTSIGWTANNKQTERAIKFWNGQDWDGNKISDTHGIVAFCWHWRNPMAAAGTTGSYKPGSTDDDDTTTFRIPYNTETDSWNTTTTAYQEMIADLDVIAVELTKLQTAGVPVLWRPMHEGAGNLGGGWDGAAAWFWWGAGNTSGVTSTDVDICGESYIALWKLMYKYFTETKGLHNLIWVWNGQNSKFYPGSAYVDIIGDDIYDNDSDGTYRTNKTKFNEYQAIDSSKLTTLSETGNLPDITTDGALWSYFMIWNDGKCDADGNVTTDTDVNNFWSGTYFNTAAKKKEIFVTNSAAITLDELPDLTSYESKK